MNDDFDLEALAVRAGTKRSQFNEHSGAMFLTSSFVFENAAQATATHSRVTAEARTPTGCSAKLLNQQENPCHA